MFFILSKVLGFIALPSNIIVILGLVGVLLIGGRWTQLGVRLSAASVLLIAICGFSPLGTALLLPLENRFAPWNPSHGAPDGIVVLGGAFENAVSGARAAVSLNEAAERMTSAVELARRFPAAKIVFSGGHGALFPQGPSEAELALRLFDSLGIKQNRVLLDDRSRNTAENAIFSKAVAIPKPGERWLLVTSAHHMPRAVGAFRRAGFEVDPYPVDWRSRGGADLLAPFGALSDGLKRTDTATREWIGLCIYWLTDQSSALFPGPAK
jgi:uncharacterized SAM-binding protein YcdF (DUF218 family)